MTPPNPALHPKQCAEFIVPSLSAMTQIEIKGSFIRCECLTFPVTMYFSKEHPVPASVFFQEFSAFLETTVLKSC